ncbi:hypothetical protein HTT03_14465 [Sulfitobacter sp. S0837]|uniref:hypothetical protein n=1 Tax=Sulfitobacter maritimus TaxID=2741719 RepID=UPI001582A116|nr:hypothetical protein [Sulfitobacter maritimus]NUH66485.1 hypothetical protein [Sulfitobacter maritimus]
MQSVTRVHLRRVMVTALLALALASIPFAHRGQAERLQDPAFIAFVQAGGDLSDLCTGSALDHELGTPVCEACRLVAGFILPSPVQMLIAPQCTLKTEPRLHHTVQRTSRSAGPPPARGPPVG